MLSDLYSSCSALCLYCYDEIRLYIVGVHCICAIIQFCVFLDMHTIVCGTDSLVVCWISLEYKYVITILPSLSADKELVAAKERQEIELAAQRATLQEQRTHIDILDTALTNAQSNVVRLEEEVNHISVYFVLLQNQVLSCFTKTIYLKLVRIICMENISMYRYVSNDVLCYLAVGQQDSVVSIETRLWAGRSGC